MSARRDVAPGGHTHRQSGTDAGRVEARRRAYELRLGGRTHRQISEDLGVSTGTVHNYLREEISERLDPLKDHYLQMELDRLDHLQQVALKLIEHPGMVVEDHEGKTHVILDQKKIESGFDRALKVSESRRKLLGLDAPVRVQGDFSVTETTQEDLELQELIREAKAKAAASAEALRATSPEASW